MDISLTMHNDVPKFPQNSADRYHAPYVLDAMAKQLNASANRLLSDETDAKLNFLDLAKNAKGTVT